MGESKLFEIECNIAPIKASSAPLKCNGSLLAQIADIAEISTTWEREVEHLILVKRLPIYILFQVFKVLQFQYRYLDSVTN